MHLWAQEHGIEGLFMNETFEKTFETKSLKVFSLNREIEKNFIESLFH